MCFIRLESSSKADLDCVDKTELTLYWYYSLLATWAPRAGRTTGTPAIIPSALSIQIKECISRAPQARPKQMKVPKDKLFIEVLYVSEFEV